MDDDDHRRRDDDGARSTSTRKRNTSDDPEPHEGRDYPCDSSNVCFFLAPYTRVCVCATAPTCLFTASCACATFFMSVYGQPLRVCMGF